MASMCPILGQIRDEMRRTARLSPAAEEAARIMKRKELEERASKLAEGASGPKAKVGMPKPITHNAPHSTTLIRGPAETRD